MNVFFYINENLFSSIKFSSLMSIFFLVLVNFIVLKFSRYHQARRKAFSSRRRKHANIPPLARIYFIFRAFPWTELL